MLEGAIAEKADSRELLQAMSEGQKTASGPGVLRGRIAMTLHTIQAVQIFEGRAWSREKAAIPGLYKFAANLETVATGSKACDPYADWCLVRIERSFNENEESLRAQLKVLEDQRDAIQGLKIGAAESIEPKVYELKLRSPHAFCAARMIGLLDRVINTLLTLSHVGLVGKTELGERVRRLLRQARRPFHLSQGYRFSGITREDIGQQIAKAIEVANDRGELPAEIIDGSLMPLFSMAPKKSKIPAAQAIVSRQLVAAETAVEPASLVDVLS